MNFFNPHLFKRSPVVYVAVSGGVDSVVLLDKAVRDCVRVEIVHYVHDSEYSSIEYDFVAKLANTYNLPLHVAVQKEEELSGRSIEEYWRSGRMDFLRSFDDSVLTGHTLDDAVEWYLMTCLTGEGHYMQFRQNNLFKPLLLTPKSDVVAYAKRKRLRWIDDPSNEDITRRRNHIRHKLLPIAVDINPGLKKCVKNRLYEKYFDKVVDVV